METFDHWNFNLRRFHTFRILGTGSGGLIRDEIAKS